MPSYIAWWQRHIGVNNLPKIVTQLCSVGNWIHADMLIASATPPHDATAPPHTTAPLLEYDWLNSSAYCHVAFCTLQGYVLKLTSSLSTATYDYTLPEVQFMANVSYRHFTLRFDVQVCNVVSRRHYHFVLSISDFMFVEHKNERIYSSNSLNYKCYNWKRTNVRKNLHSTLKSLQVYA